MPATEKACRPQLTETSVSFAQSSGELVLDRLAHDVETVVLPDLFRHPEGDVVALDGLRGLGVVEAQPLGPHEDGARRRTADEQFVARTDRLPVDREAADTRLCVVARALAAVELLLRRARAVAVGALEHRRPLVPAVPEPAVEDRRETLVPGLRDLLAPASLEDCIERFAVALDRSAHVFGTAGAALDLEDGDARLHHQVQKADGLQVLRGHEVAVVERNLRAALAVDGDVVAPAALQALAPVGALASRVQAQPALSAHGHAERAVAEHLDAHGPARGALDALAVDRGADVRHLAQRQLARKHDDVGELRVKAQGLDVRDVELRGEMHLDAELPAALHDRNVGGDDGRDARGLRGRDDLAHGGEVAVVDDGVDGEVAFGAVLAAEGRNLIQVVDREAARRVRAHVERTDPEVDAVGARLQGGRQAFARARGGHDFEVGSLHVVCLVGWELKNGGASILADAATALVPRSPPFLQKLLPRLRKS